MGLLDLFIVASKPVVKVLLITALGFLLALDHFDVLGEDSRKHLNKVAFFVFNPALVGSSLAKTITVKSFLSSWFMPVNVFFTFLFGSALGWILVKLTKAPSHLKGLIIGACSAGNLGILPIIIIPAICKERGSPLGDPDLCQTYGLGYASLSMALGAVFLWSYVYNIVRISSRVTTETSVISAEPLLSTTDDSLIVPANQIPLSCKLKQRFKEFSKKTNLRALLAPSTIGAMVGFAIGMIWPIRKLLIGKGAPLHVIEDSAAMLGDAATPTVTLILGANLLRGLKGSDIHPSIVIGVVVVRYLFLPVLGVLVVRSAVHYGLVQPDPLFQFALLLQYAVPPAMNIGTITQIFGTGQSECSVIILWTYALASVALTLWSTLFLWLVTS